MTTDSRLHIERVRLHRQELLDEAERRRRAATVAQSRPALLRLFAKRLRPRPPAPAAANHAILEVRIRYAGPEDASALAHVAALDGAEDPQRPVFVAEVDGDLLAALSLSDGRLVVGRRPTEVESGGGGIRTLGGP